VGSNPEKVNGGGRKGIRPKFAPELHQSLHINQGANSTTSYREYREYELHDLVQGIPGV